MFKCTACGEVGKDFNRHKCPATPKPNKGESFSDYQARAEKFAKEWREKNDRLLQAESY